MIGAHLLLVSASARFFVPAGYPASVRGSSDAPLPPRAMPNAAPVIAHSKEDQRLFASIYFGLFAGVAALGFGLRSARKAFRRNGHDQAFASKLGSIRLAWAEARRARRLRRAPARALQEDFALRACADPRTPAPQMHIAGDKNYKEDAVPGEVPEVPFEVRLSIGNIVTFSGAALLIFCLGKFLLNNGDSDVVSTFGFVYAIPALVGGLALKYAELAPVPLTTSPEAQAKRESIGTTIQKQILSDATRYSYGDAHMEEPLRALKLAPKGLAVPELVHIAEAVTPTGQYSMTMRFHAPNTPYRTWKKRGARYARFFAPDVRAVLKIYDKSKRLVELSLITIDRAAGESDEPLELLPDGSYARLNESGWSNGGWVDDSLPAWDLETA